MLTNPLRFDNVNDVHRRLDKTFIKFRGRAVYVMDCQENLNIRCVDVSDPNFKNVNVKVPVDNFIMSVHSSDVDLDLTSPRLGWAFVHWNRTSRPLFFLRTVNRQFKQGIDTRSLLLFDPASSRVGNYDGELSRGYQWRDWPDLGPFADMINDKVHNSIEAAVSSSPGLPLNTRWALVRLKGKTMVTYHDSVPVGTYTPSTRTFFFARHMLTKTRRNELIDILNWPENRGTYYAVTQQE